MDKCSTIKSLIISDIAFDFEQICVLNICDNKQDIDDTFTTYYIKMDDNNFSGAINAHGQIKHVSKSISVIINNFILQNITIEPTNQLYTEYTYIIAPVKLFPKIHNPLLNITYSSMLNTLDFILVSNTSCAYIDCNIDVDVCDVNKYNVIINLKFKELAPVYKVSANI